MEFKKKLIVVVGPTAIGKTSLAIQLAQHYKADILSADSRQFYKEMSIGTAKPNAKELSMAKHFFIDNISIHENYTVGHFEKEALSVLNTIFLENDIAVLVGGSGLYINALVNGLHNFPEISTETQNKIDETYSQFGLQGIQDLLKELDPQYYNKVDLNNPHRILRALAVCVQSGKPYSSYLEPDLTNRNFEPIFIGLQMDRALLYQRIIERVLQMMDQNLLEEVKQLLPFKHLNALQTVGYTELFDYLENKIDLETAVAQIQQHTRNYAKRQITWFKKNKAIQWFAPHEWLPIINYIDTALHHN